MPARLLPQYWTKGRKATPFPPGDEAVTAGAGDGDAVGVRVGVGVDVGVRVGVEDELGFAVGVRVGVELGDPAPPVSMTSVTLSIGFSRE